ncbi:MAG: hypothetical protein ACE5OS_00930 [Anaerolineae bacterium]
MTRNPQRAKRDTRPPSAMLLLLLVTAWLYGHALDFGFIWDDPLWYGRVVGRSVGELIKPMPDYHFYRPALVLYNYLFLRPDGSLDAPLLHAAQVGYHLLNVALVFALSRRLRLGGWTAVAAAALVAWCPFSYQAVAWAAPAQPMAAALQSAALLAYFEARRDSRRNYLVAGFGLLLFLVALAVQEGVAVLAILPLLVELVVRRRAVGKTHWWLPLAYLIVAAGFGLLWLRLPRRAGYTTLEFEASTPLYLLQGVVFPLLGRPAGYEIGQAMASGTLLALVVLALGGLLVAAYRAGQGRQALFGLAWALLGIAPSAAGLDYSYVSLGERLLYLSSPGVALLWACALLPSVDKSPVRRVWRIVGLFLLGLITLQSGLLLTGFRRTYAVGVAHLNELVRAVQTEAREAREPRLLFVNFPDRYRPRRSPYPVGYWGVILAPVSVDLGAFPAIVTGQHPHTFSRSVPWLDAASREAGPYEMDLRGVITPPDQLYQLAHQMDAVYLSRYHPDGTFELQWAGAVASATHTDPASACRLAVFGQVLCLQAAQVDPQPDRLSLTLTWLSLSAAQAHDTIFVHLGPAGQPPIAQADGDAWLGMLPLAFWQPGDAIREQRFILLPEGAPLDQCEIRIGAYNRVTGERLPATTVQGEPLPDDAVSIGRSCSSRDFHITPPN